MNKQNAKDYLPIIQAWAEGKTIQFRQSSGWKDINEDEVAFALPPHHYRVKPEPQEVWVNKIGRDLYAHPSEKAAKENASSPISLYEYVAKRFVEAGEET